MAVKSLHIAFSVLLVTNMTLLQTYSTSKHKSSESTYPPGSLSCKLFDITSLDCSQRNLSTIPSLSTAYPNITSLDLHNNFINNLSPSPFADLLRLIHLDLGNNSLVNISSSPFADLVELAELDISHNKLSILAAKAFAGLHELLVLDLSVNKLSYLQDGIFMNLQSLFKLDLSDNNFEAIPNQAIGPLHLLTILDLSLNPIINFTIGAEFNKFILLSDLKLFSSASVNNTIFKNDTFKNLANSPLQTLHFQFNNEYNVIIESGIFEPLRFLKTLQYANDVNALQSVNQNMKKLFFIYSGEMKEESLQFLSKLNSSLQELTILLVSDGITGPAFKWFPNLKVLDLSNIYYSLRKLSPDAFFGLNSLQQLYLKNNRIQDIPSEALKPFAASNSLLKLDLSLNALQGFFHDDAFSSLTSLTHLFLSYNPIYKVGAWMNVLINLTILRLDHNSGAQDIVTDQWTTPLLSLRQMELGYPTNKDILRFGGFEFSKQAPNLEVLTLEEAYIYDILQIKNLPKLKSLIAIGTFVLMDDIASQWTTLFYPNLEVLDLSSNDISSLDGFDFNQTTPMLRQLALDNNQIQVIVEETLSGLTNLQYLSLANNAIQSLEAFARLYTIQTLLLPNNDIIEIPTTFIDGITSSVSSLSTLDLSGNLFICKCPVNILSFRDWILSDAQILLKPNLMYQCKSPKSKAGLSVTQLELDCTDYLPMWLSIGLTAGFVVIIAGVITVRYRWHIKYRMFLLCHWRRRDYELLAEDNNANITTIRYDAFVSYAHENDDDLDWVLNDLQPNMENGPDPVKLCIGHARDFIPGSPLIEAITDSVRESRKTIVVLTPAFLESEWCYFETQQAWMRLMDEGQDVLILILLKPIPDSKMTMWLRQFLLRKDYFKWPSDKPGQRLFWRCLKEEIRTRTKVDRKYDA